VNIYLFLITTTFLLLLLLLLLVIVVIIDFKVGFYLPVLSQTNLL
jgi:hypothetical protein